VKTVKVKFELQSKASRVELLVRLVYWIPLAIVLFVLGILAAVSWVVTLFSILILGKRFLSLVRFNAIYVRYHARFCSYYAFVTDERPPIVPEDDKE
jgi:hypothetical protein